VCENQDGLKEWSKFKDNFVLYTYGFDSQIPVGRGKKYAVRGRGTINATPISGNCMFSEKRKKRV
jgi:hypothetical protein